MSDRTPPGRKPLALTRRDVARVGVGLLGLSAFGPSAWAQGGEPLTYLLPAPKDSVSLAPFTLAESLGFYAGRNLRVDFRVVPGGFKVGEALARGEGDLGGASGDTPILLRASGVAVKSVAVLGKHAFLTLVTDHGRRLSPRRLKGARLGVPSFQDLTYYALDAQIMTLGLKPDEITVRSASPPQLWTQLGDGELDGFIGTVDWGVRAERGGRRLDYVSVDSFFPAMAQTILATDAQIADNPERISRFVSATLQAITLICHEPDAAAVAYVEATPASELTLTEIKRTFRLLARHVYGAPPQIGPVNPRRAMALQHHYARQGLIGAELPIETLFTDRLL